MEIEIQSKEKLKKAFIIKLLRKEIEEKEQKKYKELSKSLNLKGFRIGAVPATVIKSHFGNKIYNDILNSLLYENFTEFLKKENIQIIEHSITEPIIEDQDDYVNITLSFEIFPKIDLDFTKFKIKKYDSDITETDIQTDLNNLKTNHGTWQDVLSETKLGDKIIIDLYYTKDSNIQYIYNTVEINTFESTFQIQNLKDVLINKNLNKKYFFKLTNNELEEIENIKDHIVLEIKHIKRFCPANITDKDFLEKIGFKNQTNQNINDFIKNKLIKTKDYLSNILMQEEIFKNLREQHVFDIPLCLIEQKIKISDENESNESIINKIKIQLILNEIKKKYNIIISKTELDEQISFLNENNLTNEIYKKNIIKHIENDLYMKKILKTIIEKITVIDEKITFDTLTKIGEKS